MPEEESSTQQKQEGALARRSFLHVLFGGALAAIAGWIAGAFPRAETANTEKLRLSAAEARISALETKIRELTEALEKAGRSQPLAQLEGGENELVVFYRKELSLVNPAGVLLNLVATSGPVGIRFYKDFGFGNEQETNPWHMGYIEGNPGYQGLAILRDWRFTAALWDEDGKLLLGRLDPHPPANEPAKARFQVRGRADEIQTIVEASKDQSADIFQVVSGEGAKHLTVNSAGDVVVGSRGHPSGILLHDTVDGSAYSLKVTHGRVVLTKI